MHEILQLMVYNLEASNCETKPKNSRNNKTKITINFSKNRLYVASREMATWLKLLEHKKR